VQRVSRAEVRVAAEQVGAIGPGFLVLLGVAQGDTPADAVALARKIGGLRVFSDGEGKMNLDLAATGGAVLLVSQITLLADVRKGRRPSFVAAADPDDAAELVGIVAEELGLQGLNVEAGRFGEMMSVELVNEGPVTIVIDVSGGAVA
jgi:D-tyrosyl-tRNA(Tyr) deacylase